MINKMNKELYIFGAGASKSSAQMPLGAELVWDYVNDCGTFFQMENGKALQSDIEEKKNEFVHFGEFLEIAGKIYPELSDEKEKWLKGMEDAVMYFPPFLSSENKKYFFDEMLAISAKNKDEIAVKKIKNAIYAHIADKSRYQNDKTIYLDFLKSKISVNVTIISLNFDALIKEDYEENVCIDYMVDFHQFIANRWYKKFVNCFPLLKLHGSIDWGWCKECGSVILNGPWVNSDSYKGIECQNCKNSIEPFIFVPFENAEEYPEWFAKLWKQAKIELSTSDTIYFIGYSIPEYDHDMLHLLKSSISENAKIEIVDPQAGIVKNKLLKLGLKSENITANNTGFREYLENINVLKS
jgi:NAD-dependent SIR2 family protein deacetylase